MQENQDYQQLLNKVDENFSKAIEKVFTREKFMTPTEIKEIHLTKDSEFELLI